MHISDFDYDLPSELIAREPADPRDAARMMVLQSKPDRVIDTTFRNLLEFLRPSDILVLNDTRVLRARTEAQLERRNGTSRKIEIFFAGPLQDNAWEVLCKPGRRIRPGDRAVFGDGELTGVFRESHAADLHVLELQSADRVLERYGRIPLPPYIDRPVTEADEVNYQTVFAARPGAVAAPTAGLHFTPESIRAIRATGIEVVFITLHVGIGTFLPVRTERPEEHTLWPERYEISFDTADRLQDAVRDNRRVVAVGTTTTRTIEHVIREHGEVRPGSGSTNLYILPGFDFRIVGALLTNFHLPQSTLLMLVSAFGGRERILAAYRHAIAERYHFYSYGDCMLIQR
jgi:S-adenosylmethionine:tRNA ribosyltransferase-isomerase